MPAVVLERSLELAGKAQHQYDAFAARGEDLVKKIRTQKSTQDLVAQAEQTVAIGKGAVTTVRKAVSDTQASAKATITTGRHQAVRVAGVVNDVVSREVKDADARRGRRRGRHSGRGRQDRDPGQAHPHDRSQGCQGHHGPHQGDRHLRSQGCPARPQGDQGRRPEGRRLTPASPPTGHLTPVAPVDCNRPPARPAPRRIPRLTGPVRDPLADRPVRIPALAH